MSGYKRDIVMRIAPVNGSDTVLWFSDRLSDVGSHVSAAVAYPVDMTVRVDCNRVRRPVVYATYANVQIEVFIASMGDQSFVQDVDNALSDPLNFAVFLSLDGGVTEREMVRMAANESEPRPLKGKTCVGASFVFSLQSKYPIGPRGPMMTDPATGREMLQDPGIEQWVGGAPQAWSGNAATGGETITVTQETTIVDTANGSVSSAKIVRSAGSQYLQFIDLPGMTTLKQGAWYLAKIAGRSSGAVAQSMGIDIINGDSNDQCHSDGKTWSPGFLLVPWVNLTGGASWNRQEGYFRLPSNYIAGQRIFFRNNGYFTGTIYLDTCSVYGPVLRPGVATW